MNRARPLAVVETHPIQYHAPVYRAVQQEFGIPVTAIYGSDFSLAGYHDAEFGTAFRWDVDLISGYTASFLSRVDKGGGQTMEEVTTHGLERKLRELDPAAVLLVGYSPRFHRDAFFTVWRSGYRLMFRGETTDHAVRRARGRTAARSALLRAFYGRFAALLYVGCNSRQHFERLGVASSRLFFSPYCVDTTPFQLDARATLRAHTRSELEIAQDNLVILFAGKLSPRKAPELVLSAVKMLPEAQRAQTTLLFMGDGELRAELGVLASQEPAVRVVFTGFQNQSQLSRFYHASDLLVLPSRAGETWGLVVNEALYHGVPCVVSNRVGCAPDLVIANETGHVFRADDADDLRRAIGQVARWNGNAAMQANCRARAEMYSTRRAAEGIATAFEMVLGGK